MNGIISVVGLVFLLIAYFIFKWQLDNSTRDEQGRYVFTYSNGSVVYVSPRFFWFRVVIIVGFGIFLIVLGLL